MFTATWALLRFQKLPLSAMGFDQPLLRSRELLGGLVLAASFSVLQHMYLAAAGGFSWQFNADYSLAGFLGGLRYNVNSVLYEEFLFRGWLLFMAVRYLGPARATVLSSVVFGIYHWFSFGVFGHLVPMLFVFVVTGLAGWMYTAAFVKSGSLALPIGLHFGWNYTGLVVFSNGNIGAHLLIPDVPAPGRLGDAASLVYTGISILLPIAALLLLRNKPNQLVEAKSGTQTAAGLRPKAEPTG